VAKLSYRRLAAAMVELLDEHSVAEVTAAAAAVMAAAAHPNLERLLPDLERELARQQGHFVVRATSARPLPVELLDQLAAELTKRLGGRSHELETAIDPSLLGGVRLTTADASLDLSLRSRLEQIRI
jgi:F-type H+-transporting ATPase subunit delta